MGDAALLTALDLDLLVDDVESLHHLSSSQVLTSCVS